MCVFYEKYRELEWNDDVMSKLKVSEKNIIYILLFFIFFYFYSSCFSQTFFICFMLP